MHIMCNNIFLETNCDKRQVNFVTLIRKQFNGAKYSKTHPFKEVGLGRQEVVYIYQFLHLG